MLKQGLAVRVKGKAEPGHQVSLQGSQAQIQ